MKVMFLSSLLILQACSGVEILRKKEEIRAPFDGKRFDNLGPFPDKSFWTVLKWRLTSKRAEWKAVEEQTFYKVTDQRSKDLKLTLIGHSTVLIQMNNINILTDPTYSDRASPVSWTGPKRVIKPAIKFEDLPVFLRMKILRTFWKWIGGRDFLLQTLI